MALTLVGKRWVPLYCSSTSQTRPRSVRRSSPQRHGAVFAGACEQSGKISHSSLSSIYGTPGHRSALQQDRI